MFALYSFEFLKISEDRSSHQSFPAVSVLAATLTELHRGFERHLNVQSQTSRTEDLPAPGTSRKWNSFLMNTCWREVCGLLEAVVEKKSCKFCKSKQVNILFDFEPGCYILNSLGLLCGFYRDTKSWQFKRM